MADWKIHYLSHRGSAAANQLARVPGSQSAKRGCGIGALFPSPRRHDRASNRRLFETALRRSNQPPSYDVAPDGRFIMITRDESRDEPITVSVNWAEADLVQSG